MTKQAISLRKQLSPRAAELLKRIIVTRVEGGAYDLTSDDMTAANSLVELGIIAIGHGMGDDYAMIQTDTYDAESLIGAVLQCFGAHTDF